MHEHKLKCRIIWIYPQVNLNLPNNRGETPLDIAQYNLPERVFYDIQVIRHPLILILLFWSMHGRSNDWDKICAAQLLFVLLLQSIEAQIHLTLTHAGSVKGVHRQDHLLEDNITLGVVNAAFDESKETEVLKESTGALCIGSVLIATVTFGATFAVPGGYIADDHSNNGGTPVLARRYAFDAFILSNTWAFVLSTVATTALMQSGNPLLNLWSRRTNLLLASYCVSVSVTCLVAAFALAAYVVLAPVAQNTAHGIAILTCLVLLYNQLEFIFVRLRLLPPLRTRKGLIRALVVSALAIMGAMLLHYWPLIFIFSLAA